MKTVDDKKTILIFNPAAGKGKGVCVGTRFEGVRWRVIEIDDGPIEETDARSATEESSP